MITADLTASRDCTSLKTMATFLLVTLLLAISSSVLSAQTPCTGESCSNLNVFLGPKWGSKTLRIPSNLNVRGPSGGEVDIPAPAVDEVDDSGVKPTDWFAKSDDETNEEVSETDWVAEPYDSVDEDDSDSDWTDDSSQDLNSTAKPADRLVESHRQIIDWIAEPNDSGDEDEDDSDWSDDSAQELNSTAKPADRLVETHGQLIDWIAESSTKLSAKLIQPTNKPTDLDAQTERTETTQQNKRSSSKSPVPAEFQDVTMRHVGSTANSRRITPEQSSGPEDDSYAIDYTYDYENDFGFGNDDSTKTSSKTWISVANLNELFDKGALNLTGFGFSGEQVKQTLARLSVDTKTQLRRLSLSNNQLKSLPTFTFPVELEYGLVELSLDHNPLGVLDSFTRFELSRLGKLKVLSLARTGLRSFESLYIPSLETLDLSGNQLVELPWPMDGLRILQQLDLSSNHISRLSGPPPHAFESLRFLNLSHNGLELVLNHAFEKMISLDVLCLNDNKLRYSMQLEDIPDYVTLYLAGNPWECSCPLVRFVHDPRSIQPAIADKSAMLCTDENIRVPWPLRTLREQDVTIDCPRRWDWLRLPLRRVVRWFNSHGWRMSTLLSMLWWALLVGGLVAVWRVVRRVRNTPAPYSILDDKQVLI